MDETKRHLVTDVEASELPERFRGGFPPDAHVDVIVQEAEQRPRRRLTDLIGKGRGLYKSPEDVLEELRKLRDDD